MKNIEMIEPINYSKILSLLSKTKLLLTDSGGLQKEAYWSKTPCFTFRKSTEWIETLNRKNNQLINHISNNTKKQILLMLEKNKFTDSHAKNVFGDGHASKKIISLLLKQF